MKTPLGNSIQFDILFYFRRSYFVFDEVVFDAHSVHGTLAQIVIRVMSISL